MTSVPLGEGEISEMMTLHYKAHRVNMMTKEEGVTQVGKGSSEEKNVQQILTTQFDIGMFM